MNWATDPLGQHQWIGKLPENLKMLSKAADSLRPTMNVSQLMKAFCCWESDKQACMALSQKVSYLGLTNTFRPLLFRPFFGS